MKSLNQFILENTEFSKISLQESAHKFPVTIAEWNNEMDDYEYEDMVYALNHIFEKSDAKSVVIYSEGKRKGEMIYDEVVEDVEDLLKMLNNNTWRGYIITLEDPTTFGIIHLVSGPRQRPSKFFRFSSLWWAHVEETIEEENGEEKIKKSFIDVSKFI